MTILLVLTSLILISIAVWQLTKILELSKPVDFENNELSGGLSENKLNCLNIGPLSRFENYKNDDSKILFKYLAIISGPENQRSLLEKEIKNCFLKSNYQCAIVNGKTIGEKN